MKICKNIRNIYGIIRGKYWKVKSTLIVNHNTSTLFSFIKIIRLKRNIIYHNTVGFAMGHLNFVFQVRLTNGAGFN